MKDIENIGDWEYKVVSYGSKDFRALEKDLNELGKERWQCFWVEAAEEKVFLLQKNEDELPDEQNSHGGPLANHRRFSEQLIGIGLICL